MSVVGKHNLFTLIFKFHQICLGLDVFVELPYDEAINVARTRKELLQKKLAFLNELQTMMSEDIFKV